MGDDAHSMASVTITEQDDIAQLSTVHVNKAYGPDELHPRLLNCNEAAKEITYLLIKVFNASLNLKTFLSSWKGANILHCLKKTQS